MKILLKFPGEAIDMHIKRVLPFLQLCGQGLTFQRGPLPLHTPLPNMAASGAFLGVVTEFVLQLNPVPPVLPLITATYPLSLLGLVSAGVWVAGWLKLASGMDIDPMRHGGEVRWTSACVLYCRLYYQRGGARRDRSSDRPLQWGAWGR